MKTNPRFLTTVILTCLLSAFFFNASAQSLTGKVVDENDQPLAYANVILHRADTTFIAGTVTDTSGVFILDPHSEGAMIQVSFVSYETCYLTITDKNLGTIKMVLRCLARVHLSYISTDVL